jgi:hypothetical protein
MMGPSGKEPSARSLTELVDLILKLNAKIREKISPRRKGETKGAKNTEMVIIILNHSSGAPAKAPRREKARALGKNWIEDLCGDIEKEGNGQKAH